MAITATSLTADEDANGGNATTASISPGAGRLLLVFIGSGNSAVASVSGLSLTWTQAHAHQRGANPQHGSIWWAATGASPGSGAISINAVGTFGNVLWDVVQVTGANLADPIVQVADSEDTTDSVSLGSAVTAGNATFMHTVLNAQGLTISAGGSATLLGAAEDDNNPSITHVAEYISAGTQTMSFTVSGTPIPTQAIVEIEAAPIHTGAATLTGTGDLTAAGQIGFTHNAAATASGTGALTASAQRTAVVAAAMSGTGALTATARQTFMAAATASGLGSLLATATRLQNAIATASGTGALTAAAVRQHNAVAAAAGTGDLSASATQTHATAATLTGLGDLLATAQWTANAAATASGAGALTAAGTVIKLAAAALSGAGDLTSAAQAVKLVSATLTGTGALTATGELWSNFRRYAVESDPDHWWRADESSGTLFDSVGGVHATTVFGTPIYGITSPIIDEAPRTIVGGDSTTDGFRADGVVAPVGGGDLTIGLVVQYTTASLPVGAAFIFGVADSDSEVIAIGVNGTGGGANANKIVGECSSSGDVEDVFGPVIGDGLPHFVALVYRSTGRFDLWVDGANVGNITLSVPVTFTGTQGVLIGDNNFTTAFIGQYGHMMIWRRQLTELEIQKLAFNVQVRTHFLAATLTGTGTLTASSILNFGWIKDAIEDPDGWVTATVDTPAGWTTTPVEIAAGWVADAIEAPDGWLVTPVEDPSGWS